AQTAGILPNHGRSSGDKRGVAAPGAAVSQVEVNHIRRVAKYAGDYAEICAIEMKTREVAGKREICPPLHHDEVLVHARHLGRKLPRAHVFAVGIADADRQSGDRYAARVAAYGPARIKDLELGNPVV